MESKVNWRHNQVIFLNPHYFNEGDLNKNYIKEEMYDKFEEYGYVLEDNKTKYNIYTEQYEQAVEIIYCNKDKNYKIIIVPVKYILGAYHNKDN